MMTQEQKSETKQQSFVQKYKWVLKQKSYSTLRDIQIQNENKRILQTLKELSQLVNKQLMKAPKKIIKMSNPNTELQILQEHFKNNLLIIKNLNGEYKKYEGRRQLILAGKQQRLTQNKYNIQQQLIKLRIQLKDTKNQIRQLQKKLVETQKQVPHQRQLIDKLEEQLRIHSTKYVTYLKKYQQSQQKMSLITVAPPIFLNKNGDLDQKQSAQYKQYLNIVKLSQILQHRNQSQYNKSNRIYSMRLKDLQQLIQKIDNTDKQLNNKQSQILESKKQLEQLKSKLKQQQGGQSVNLRRQSLSMRYMTTSQKERAYENENSVKKKENNQKVNIITQRKSSGKKIFLGQNYFQLEPINKKIKQFKDSGN